MVSRRDALLNLAPLLNRAPGAADEVSGSGLLEPEETLLAEDGLMLGGPLEWQVTVRNAGGDDDFIVEGAVSGTAVLECRRCLDEVPTSARATFLLPMAYRAGEADLRLDEVAEDDEELLLFGHPEVDFAGLLTQLFAIELPLTVVCSEDCRGLSLDGVDLNEHPEAQDEIREGDRPSSPFEVLKDLDLTS
jgi:uncharacterized protein